MVASSVTAIEISHEFPGCTAKSVSYEQKLLDVPVAEPLGTTAIPVKTASPSLIELPEILISGTNSSAASAVTAIEICFMLVTFDGTVKLLDTELVPRLSKAWKAPVAANCDSLLDTTIAMFIP